MHSRRTALIGITIAAVLLLSGCHRLGLIKSPAKPSATGASTGASTTASPSGAASAITNISIAVQNGGGIKGRGAAMASRLTALGFQPGKATNAKLTDYPSTVIFYNPGYAAQAAQVQKVLGLGKVQPATPDVVFAGDVLVIVGKDF